MGAPCGSWRRTALPLPLPLSVTGLSLLTEGGWVSCRIAPSLPPAPREGGPIPSHCADVLQGEESTWRHFGVHGSGWAGDPARAGDTVPPPHRHRPTCQRAGVLMHRFSGAGGARREGMWCHPAGPVWLRAVRCGLPGPGASGTSSGQQQSLPFRWNTRTQTRAWQS